MNIIEEHTHEIDNETNRPRVIAYYTTDTPYEAEAEVLKASLETVGYSYTVCGVPNLKSWQKNTQYKAMFVRHMLQTHSGQPLLYLDVDSVMVEAPEVLDGLTADIAAVHFCGRNELLSGTVYFGNTECCNRCVDEWIRLNEQYPERLPDGREAWDQRTLKMAIEKTKGLHFVELPQEYTWIVELTQRHMPGLSPVIMHTRGAKRFKRKINGQKGFEK